MRNKLASCAKDTLATWEKEQVSLPLYTKAVKLNFILKIPSRDLYLQVGGGHTQQRTLEFTLFKASWTFRVRLASCYKSTRAAPVGIP